MRFSCSKVLLILISHLLFVLQRCATTKGRPHFSPHLSCLFSLVTEHILPSKARMISAFCSAAPVHISNRSANVGNNRYRPTLRMYPRCAAPTSNSFQSSRIVITTASALIWVFSNFSPALYVSSQHVLRKPN